MSHIFIWLLITVLYSLFVHALINLILALKRIIIVLAFTLSAVILFIVVTIVVALFTFILSFLCYDLRLEVTSGFFQWNVNVSAVRTERLSNYCHAVNVLACQLLTCSLLIQKLAQIASGIFINIYHITCKLFFTVLTPLKNVHLANVTVCWLKFF